MAKISIEFDTGDAAFDDRGDEELEFVMSNATRRISDNNPGKLYDSNGNSIGEVKIEY